ncbi:hypothetical protein ORJ04_21365 [Rheinheimera baltica]|uniref:DUF2721 domain-containing protein n=1 Tax=Rheinheimera baltica TaxID=67576 RepID=A0ABT9I517_9GAMM|nr:hypothetical protein [Rheinheimera baltica]MDP5138501.1 hypothetical protein [Rheinheimera baltica]MDP5150603.1 hypothetical protein [Rheinheimera baltica]
MDTQTPNLLLSNFSSLLEVAIAINIVSATWSAIRDKAINKFKSLSKEHKNTIHAALGERYAQSRCITTFESASANYESKLVTFARYSVICCYLIAIFLLALLALLGFKPDFTINLSQSILLVSLSILPAFILQLLGNCYVFYAGRKMSELTRNQNDAIQDLQKGYDDYVEKEAK